MSVIQGTSQPSRGPSNHSGNQPIIQGISQPSRVPANHPKDQPFIQGTSQSSREPAIHPGDLSVTQGTIQPSRGPVSYQGDQPNIRDQPYIKEPVSHPRVQPTSQPSRGPGPANYPGDQSLVHGTSQSSIGTNQPSRRPATIEGISQPS
jgi:hypothetical protein